MNEAERFWGGFFCGVFAFLATLSIMLQIWGHITVETMAEIETPTMYKVTVDGVELMCKAEPEIKRNYLALWSCDSMPDSNMRVKRYLSLEFAEVRPE